mmetsp:Transcript_52818/g.169111  ORF Transcript_52818/g.169111 Transcript_52818/m.169111 type:complete len:234 (-) Transcript_52818:317-1018(-)
MLPPQATKMSVHCTSKSQVWLYNSKYRQPTHCPLLKGTSTMPPSPGPPRSSAASHHSWQWATLRSQSMRMRTVHHSFSAHWPSGIERPPASRAFTERPSGSRLKCRKMAGPSGPLSLPRPAARAKTPPQRCGRDAEGLQRKKAMLGRTVRGKHQTKPLGSKSDSGSWLAMRRHHTETGKPPMFAGPARQRSMCGGTKVPGPTTHRPMLWSAPRASPKQPPAKPALLHGLLKFS